MATSYSGTKDPTCTLVALNELNLEMASPATQKGWAILTPTYAPKTWHSQQFRSIVDQFHQIGWGTLLLDPQSDRLPQTRRLWVKQRQQQIEQVSEWLQTQSEGREMPISYVGIGDGGAAIWRSALTASNTPAGSHLVLLNASPDLSWFDLGNKRLPTLVLVDEGEARRRRLFNRWLLSRMDHRSKLVIIPTDVAAISTYLPSWQAALNTPTTRKQHKPQYWNLAPSSVARFAMHGTLALSIGLSTTAAMAPVPVQSQAIATTLQPSSYWEQQAPKLPTIGTDDPFADPFADGITIQSSQIQGDQVALKQPVVAKSTTSQVDPWLSQGTEIKSDKIRGDGGTPQGLITPFSTGSQALVDGNGVKWFVNTDITFMTSSSASGAASEASFTSIHEATTASGGVVSSTLNDAFDGYNSLCVSLTGATGTCQTGNADYTIYVQNGTAELDSTCTGEVSPGSYRQVVLPTRVVNGIEISRKVYVPDNDGFARWTNTLTNITGTVQSFTAIIGNNLGSDSNTTIFESSNLSQTVELSDTWVGTFQNYSGNTSSDVRLGHILQGPGAPVPLSNINFVNGDDNPYWVYSLTLQPGETAILLNFATGQNSKAAVAAKAKELVQLPPSTLRCLSEQEISQVVNFATDTDVSITNTASITEALPGQPINYRLDYTNLLGFAPLVEITDTLPSEVISVTLESSPSITESASAPYEWDIAGLPAGESGVITATGVISPLLSQDLSIDSMAEISNTRDITLTNNSSLATVLVKPPRVEFATAVYSATESAPTADLLLTLDRANPYADTQVRLQTGTGNAQNGVDYDAIDQVVTIPAGATQVTVSVPLHDDLIDEVDEQVPVTLADPIGGVLGTQASADMQIVDDDAAQVYIGDVSVTETDSDITASFPVTLSMTSDFTVTVDYESADGTSTPATAGSDYTSISGTVTFAPSVTLQSINLPILGDDLVEPDEQVRILLSNPVNALLGNSEATGTIFNDDTPTPTPTATRTPTSTPVPPTATATSTPVPPTATSTATPTATEIPDLHLAVTSDPPAGTQISVGGEITYFVTMSNTGGIANNLVISAQLPSQVTLITDSVTPPPSTLVVDLLAAEENESLAGGSLQWAVPVLTHNGSFQVSFSVVVNNTVPVQIQVQGGVPGNTPISLTLQHPVAPTALDEEEEPAALQKIYLPLLGK